MVPYLVDYANENNYALSSGSDIVKLVILSMRDKLTLEARRPIIARNIAFLQKWIGFVNASEVDWWKSYLMEEGCVPFQMEFVGNEEKDEHDKPDTSNL